jgi:oligopeptidase B
MLSEISQNSQNVSPEFGPTGTWKYLSSNTSEGRLLYTRSYKGIDQQVLNLEPDTQIHSMSLSVDESLIAYLCTSNSTEVVRIRHIESERELSVDLPTVNSISNLEWGPIFRKSIKGHSLYVVGTDRLGRPDRVYASSIYLDEINADIALSIDDFQLIFQCDDQAAMVDVQRTKGCQFVAIQATTKKSNEIFLSSSPTSDLIVVIPREENLLYHLDVGEKNDVVILVSENRDEYNVLEAPVDALPLDPARLQDYQTERLQPEEDYAISDMDLFRNHLIFYQRSKTTGLERIRKHERISDSNSSSVIPLPINNKECYKLSPTDNIYFGSQDLTFQLESPVNVGHIFKFDMQKEEFVEMVETESQSFAKPICYKQVFVPSSDGTKVPLSLIYQQEEDNGTGSLIPRPVVLNCYGAYGEPINLQYTPFWHSLLDRGFVLGFAHTRGGGDLGRRWYVAGCRRNKVQAIEDFEACANYLKKQYAGGKLTATSFSAGGVLVGSAVNRNPELFDNVVFTNAFLDVYKTMTNSNLYLTPHEWDEYGNPLIDSEAAEIIRSYCPIANLKVMSTCPQTLIIGTLDDENVPFSNAVIYAKKLRDCIQDFDRVHLHLEPSGGHHMGARRLHIAAIELAFIVQNS